MLICRKFSNVRFNGDRNSGKTGWLSSYYICEITFSMNEISLTLFPLPLGILSPFPQFSGWIFIATLYSEDATKWCGKAKVSRPSFLTNCPTNLKWMYFPLTTTNLWFRLLRGSLHFPWLSLITKRDTENGEKSNCCPSEAPTRRLYWVFLLLDPLDSSSLISKVMIWNFPNSETAFKLSITNFYNKKVRAGMKCIQSPEEQ